MKPEAVRFIRAELIPFMLREQGHGFAMSEWIAAIDPGVPFTADGVERNVHRCGVVACIGGSIEYLLRQRGYRHPSPAERDQMVANAIGLSKAQAFGLFHGWQTALDAYCWPADYRRRYRHAATAEQKAEVVVALLEDVIATDAACLENDEGWSDD